MNSCKTLLSIILIMAFNHAQAADYIWIEGEDFTHGPAALKQVADKVTPHSFKKEGWGNSKMMSGAQVLHVNMSAKDVETFLPDEGLVFTYEFEVKDDGPQDIWARIGYEFARSHFSWRLDQTAWETINSNQATVNVQPIQTWNELGWIKLSTSNLKKGKHTLAFKHSAYKIKQRDKEKTSRLLHMLDAICIMKAGSFHPHGKWKPDTNHNIKSSFTLNDKIGTDGRAWTELNGQWQYAAWDEHEFPISEETRCKGVNTLPNFKTLLWHAYTAPGKRADQLPEQDFCHRYILKTQISVPATLKDKGFFLDVQNSSFITSVFVNGHYVNSTETFHTAWQMDLSQHLKVGNNDLCLVIKDAYYSLNPINDESTKGLGNRRYWGIPRDFLQNNQGTAGKHDYPIASNPATGILEPASIVACGPLYCHDAFVKCSVKNKHIDIDFEFLNPQSKVQMVDIKNTILNAGDLSAVRTLKNHQLTMKPGLNTLQVKETWENPRLWFPDDPHLYQLKTEIIVNGKTIDQKLTRFGFREWDWSTHMFTLNGIKWTMWADTHTAATPKKQIELAKKSHVNQLRYWRDAGWGDMTRREALNYFDETGMIVRSSGTFDGQRANYGGGLREPDTSKEPDQRGRYPLKAKTRLFDNWRKQLEAWVREERNHARIYIWSVENEIAYINVNNLGQYREVEPELTKAVEHVMNIDPTRPGMVDGGNCLRDESLPVNGAHYTEFMNNDFRDFPDAAYVRDHFYDAKRPQRGAWRMVPDRPIMKGEAYFANGYSTERFATIGGDRCFIGIGETMKARGLWAKMLSEGYRWAEVSSFHFWLSNSERQYWNSWKPVAVFCKQWNWTWGSEAAITRDCKVFNSTQHRDPIHVSWQFKVADKIHISGKKTFTVAPGEAEAFSISFKCPKVNDITTGVFTLSAERNGKEVYTEDKAVRLLAPTHIAKPNIKQQALAVFDPQGHCKHYLQQRGIAFNDIKTYGDIPESAEVIIVGSNAIPADRSTDPQWLQLAAEGKKVVILNQQFPLSYKAIPGDLQVTSYTGRFAFSEDLSHPIFNGLTQADFFTWGNDHVVYRNAYKKGSTGGRSLVQCDNDLSCSALFESQPNNGLFILCQLALDEKLSKEAISQHVFNNLINYAVDYKPLRKHSHVFINNDDKRSQLLKQLQLKHSNELSITEALKGQDVLIVDATADKLKELAEQKQAVDAFCKRGGWIYLWGLTPDSLDAFNQLVDHKHAIRRFGKERVILNYPTSKFAAGLTLRDVVMNTGKKMYPWMALKTPDEDAITWVVDHDDIAPFCEFPKPTALGKPSDDNPGIDHWPRNMVNGFTSDDNWAFTYTVIMDRGDSRKFTLTLPKEEELIALKIRPSKIYHPISKINIYFDDDPNPISADIPVRENPIVEDIPISGRRAKTITLEITEWTERGNKNIVVIDNLWLQVKRSDAYMKNVKSLLNIGALMAYQKGSGGIFLNQINILDQEQNPDNVQKKVSIVQTTLKNLGAVFSGNKTEIDVKRYDTQAISIDDNAFNAYVHQNGKPSWFGNGDIEGIPVGEKQYAGSNFFLSDFSTSPVPSVFMLAGDGSTVNDREIKNITVNKTCDALFFLHTFHEGRDIKRWRDRRARALKRNQTPPKRPHCFSYIIHYEDNSREEAKVLFEEHVGVWNSKQPLALPQADLAWVGKQKKSGKAAVWVMRWQNPHPKKLVKSISIQSKQRNAGSAAVFAISIGNEIK